MTSTPQSGQVVRRAMILAAGRGERMRPLTDDLPKPLLQVGGKALIEHHLEALASAGVSEVVINLAWQGAKLRSALGSGERFGITLHYSDEGAAALETGGGIFKALPLLLPDPFLVINGDIWTDWRLQAGHVPATDDLAHLVLIPNPVHHPQGDFGLAGTRLVEASGAQFTFSGIGLYRKEFFAGCQPGAFPLLPLFRRAIRAGRISGEVYRGRWYDIGTPARLAALDAELGSSATGP